MQDRYETFTALIDNLKKNIRKIKAAEMQNYELKGSHISFIYYLYTSNSTMTSKELAEVCNEDKASVSRSIEYLEEQGYLVCEKQNHKRYRAPIVLTQKGIDAAKVIVNKVEAVVARAGENISDENRAVMYRVLMTINDNLQRICDGYGE